MDPEALGPVVTRQRGLRGLFLQLGLSALITLGGGLVVGLAKRASWGRLGMVGIVVLSAGVLLFVFALRGRNDAVEVRRRGLVRISGMLGTRIVPFDRIVTIEAIHGRTFFGNQPRESLAMVRVTTKDDQLVTLALGQPRGDGRAPRARDAARGDPRALTVRPRAQCTK